MGKMDAENVLDFEITQMGTTISEYNITCQVHRAWWEHRHLDNMYQVVRQTDVLMKIQG